jgi:hypothetical protein
MCHHVVMDSKPPYKPAATGQISYPYWTGEGMMDFWIAEDGEWVAKAEGQVLSRKSHPGLYAVLGHAYGQRPRWFKPWTWKRKFRLPDLRGLNPVGLVADDPSDPPPSTPPRTAPPS